jgi:hypothetical protein
LNTTRKLLVLTLAAGLPLVAHAHGPSRQKVELSVDVKADPATTWAVISDFCAIEKWQPAVAKCEQQGGNEPGATRTLTLEGSGAVIRNELLKYDAQAMSYKYKITENDVKNFPVTTYAATLAVSPGEGGGSKVTVKAGFYRGYANNDPPPELNDEAAVKAVTSLYEAGLAEIRKLAEGGQ